MGWVYMKITEKKEVLKRLNYLIGHLKGNKKMVDEGKYCIDIIRQNQAVEAALKKVDKIILRSHLETCVVPAIKSKGKSEKSKVLDEITEVFEMEQRLQ